MQGEKCLKGKIAFLLNINNMKYRAQNGLLYLQMNITRNIKTCCYTDLRLKSTVIEANLYKCILEH